MRIGVVAVTLLVVVSAALLVPNHPAGREPAEDTGIFFYAAERLLAGGMPYLDVWDHKPPGVYFVDAAGLAMAGPTGVWALQVLFLALAVLLGYLGLRREFGDAPAFIGSLAWLVALPRLFLEYGYTSFAEFFALPLQFGALLLWSRSRSLPAHFAIGVLGGAAFLLKPTLLGVWIALSVVALVAHRHKALVALLAVAVGLAAPLLLVVAWAAAGGALGEMIDQALVYNRAYSAYAPLSERVDSMLTGLRLTLPSGLTLVAIVTWLYAIATRRGLTPLVQVALVAFPLELVLSALGRGYHYYFIAWLPSMGILAAFAAHKLVGEPAAPRIRVAVTFAVVLMCLQPTLLVARLASLTTGGRIASAAAWVAANTRPDDTVWVWGSHTELLFLADRRSPTRYVYQYAPLYTRGYATPARVEELLSDLARRRPVLIIDASPESFVTPALDLAALRSWRSPDAQYAPLPELERVVSFVYANYDRVGNEPATGWTVWRLRTP